MTVGVVLAQNCGLRQIATHLPEKGRVESLERRFQRWLANERLCMEVLFRLWIGWVVKLWGQAPMLILVDETKLSDHLSVMMVSLAYQKSAIPLLWCAYHAEDYPEEGQVGIVKRLLEQLRQVVPVGVEMLVMADRGIGTSPDLIRILEGLGYDYLMRIQRSTRFLKDGKALPVGCFAHYGQQWQGRGKVFKKAGWLVATVYVVWEVGYKEPWCLVSNRSDLDPRLYACRFWQEAGFRDLKRDGFHWNQSHVWLPAHAERLLLVLAIASLWTLAQGTLVVTFYPLSSKQRQHSVFRLGRDKLRSLAPDTPSLKSVGW
jgi:hypothetical protein